MSTTTVDLKRSWLVQRLNKPRGGGILGPDNPFAFGGGMKNGGLSDDAMGLLRGIFGFDYMGSAEFEFGAVPEALRAIAKTADKLVAYSFPITLTKVAPNWRDEGPAPEGVGVVYVLCRRDWTDEVERLITGWATGKHEELKERTKLAAALRPFNDWDRETAGWLELDNGFFFFTDRDMWAATAALFGVDASGQEQS